MTGTELHTVSIQECKGDKGGNLHHGSLPPYTRDFPDLIVAHAVAAIFPAPPCPHGESGGGRERPPLFPARCGRGGVAQFTSAPHPWGGRSLPNIPAGSPGEESGRPVRALPGVRSRHAVQDPGMTTGDTCQWGPLVQVDFRRPLGRGAGPNPGRSELGTGRCRSASGSAPGPAPGPGLGRRGGQCGWWWPGRREPPPSRGEVRRGGGRRAGRGFSGQPERRTDRGDRSPQTPQWRQNPWRLTLPPVNRALLFVARPMRMGPSHGFVGLPAGSETSARFRTFWTNGPGRLRMYASNSWSVQTLETWESRRETRPWSPRTSNRVEWNPV